MIKDERSDDHPGGSTPSQYGLPPDASELQDLIEYREMNFALGNIFKACYRRGTCEHSDELRDMRKVLWFAQREIERLEREEAERMDKVRKHLDDVTDAILGKSVIPPDFDSIADEIYGLSSDH